MYYEVENVATARFFRAHRVIGELFRIIILSIGTLFTFCQEPISLSSQHESRSTDYGGYRACSYADLAGQACIPEIG